MKKRKKGSISEEHIFILLQRYNVTTVLALLQEVAQLPDVKLDWNALLKKTKTGISNAREYQMLWRHLAYGDALFDRLDDGAEPLDDNSDLEYEIEAFPSASSEASTEAAACVKVLIASGLPSDSRLSNGSTVEAPLTINIPNGQSSRTPSELSRHATFIQGTNITVPVSVQKQPLPTVTPFKGLDANGAANFNLPPKRKRKAWSAAEDMELIAAVQKCGEGNWANILKGDFKGDRTATNLSKRWSIIKKPKGKLNLGGGSQLSEAQLAARRAVSLALDMPMGDTSKAACSAVGTNSNINRSKPLHPTAAESTFISIQSQHQSQKHSAPTAVHRQVTLGSLSKSGVTSKKPTTKCAVSPDPMVKVAAVAAGARIATPSDAASLLKAAQSKNAVHIMPGGGSLIKSSGNTNPLPSPQYGAHPNVHYVCTGLAVTSLPTYSAIPTNSLRPGGTQQVQGHSARPVTTTVQLNPVSTAPQVNASSEVTNAAASSNLTNELKVKTAEDIITSRTDNEPTQLVREDQAAITGNVPREQIKEDQAAFSGRAPREQDSEGQGTFSDNPSEMHVQEDQASVSSNALSENIQEDKISILDDAPNKLVRKDQTSLPSSGGIERSRVDFVVNSNCSSTEDTTENYQPVIISKQATTECRMMNGDNMVGLPVKDSGANQSVVKNIYENQSVPSTIDRGDEKLEFACKAAAEIESGGEEKSVAMLV